MVMLVVFSDLDGTLLDPHDYSWQAARPALDLMRREGIPLVLVTSKTRLEVEAWQKLLGINHPFVVENGGALYIPTGYFDFPVSNTHRINGFEAVEFGEPYSGLVRALERASRRSGVALRGFHEMTDEDVAHACSMPVQWAKLARQREYDEPFEILDAARTGELLAAIDAEGKRWTRGGRFHHITSNNDKKRAVLTLLSLYRRTSGEVVSAGLGDAPNDASFLNEMTIPIVVRSPLSEEVLAASPRARVTRLTGAAAWNEAICGLLERRGTAAP
jgi:mannosyl-3-phosphoglycerate phosphatase